MGSSILPEDVMYQDMDVRILKPDVKKGIIIFSQYVQQKDTENICKIGLKSGYQLKKEGIEFGRSIYHPYIFFRAPYYNNSIDYFSVQSEINSLYSNLDLTNKLFIRVDPENTYTFSSEIRAKNLYNNQYLIENSRKSLNQYLQVIKENSIIENNIPKEHRVIYDLFTSRAEYFSTKWHLSKDSIKDDAPINRNSEILVRLQHLTPEYFVNI